MINVITTNSRCLKRSDFRYIKDKTVGYLDILILFISYRFKKEEPISN